VTGFFGATRDDTLVIATFAFKGVPAQATDQKRELEVQIAMNSGAGGEERYILLFVSDLEKRE